MRVRRSLTALLLAVTALLATGTPAAGDDPTPSPSVTESPTTPPAPEPTAFTISGLDLHDAQMIEADGTFYLYGSMYACGFQWYVAGTSWCGFGVSTAPTPQGPWSTPQLLFSPASVDPSTGSTWQQICGTQTGQGCFNPRMVIRTGWGHNDNTAILWFNAPRQYSLGAPHAYNAMGCNSLVGPCGPTAGAPRGSYNKPNLDICLGNGDFGMIQSGTGGRPAIVCTRPGASALSIQELNWSGTGGNQGVGVAQVAGLTKVEGPGGWWDETTQQYILTYSDPGCGYCSGVPIGYATSPTLYAGWTAPGNVGWSPPANGRRAFHPNSCGGQPRTVALLDGQPWQIIDLWVGSNGAPQRNQTNAATHLVPLHYTPTPGTPGDGQVWRPPLTLEC
ncbi:hypothetical protein [Streptomyces sp. NPDC002328]|uniref:hypothetical protein n=1 Tax=Streptomyces sp. NPDC002328 TaxID=3364642 RepID=UPI0036B8DC84